MSHVARNGGCRLVLKKCVVEVSPKCRALIHKRYILIEVKTEGLYMTEDVFTCHTHAKWYRENRRSKWYIKIICQIQL